MKERILTFLSNVWAVAYKEGVVMRHDKAFLGMVVMQPIMMLALFGYAISNEPANVPWAVLDRSGTEVSRRLVSEVQSTGYFLRPKRVSSYEEGRALLARGEVIALLVVPEDFRREALRGRPEVQVLLDGSDPLTSARVGGILGRVAAAFAPEGGRATLSAARVAAPGPAGVGSGSPVSPVSPVDVRQQFRFNPTLQDRQFFLAALAGMLLTNLCLSASSLGLVGERENGTYEQMLSLPTAPLELVLGKLLPYVGVSYVVLTIATVLPGLVFGLWPVGSWLALYAVTLPFVLGSLAIGVFVSALARSTAQAVFLTVFFILPSMVLSGVLLPYQLMPDFVRRAGALLPLRWYQIALRRIHERGAGLDEVAVPIFALCAFFAVMLAAIRWRMKPRLG